MFKIFIFLLILMCSYQIRVQPYKTTDDYDFENHEVDMITLKRVVGGYRPTEGSLAKYAVSLRERNESKHKFGYLHFCAGTIVAANKIVTAAHCLRREGKPIAASFLKVVAKTPIRLMSTPETQVINVKKVVIHPKYSDSTMFHDIGLLILEDNIVLDEKWASIISLPKKNIEAGELCTLIGWGRLYMYGPLANEILQADINLHSRKYCRKRYPDISSKKICASDLSDSEKSACSGDSGGPLICKDIFRGIVSYGYGCDSREAGLYTNVFYYVDWIINDGKSTLKPKFYMNVITLFLMIVFH